MPQKEVLYSRRDGDALVMEDLITDLRVWSTPSSGPLLSFILVFAPIPSTSNIIPNATISNSNTISNADPIQLNLSTTQMCCQCRAGKDMMLEMVFIEDVTTWLMLIEDRWF